MEKIAGHEVSKSLRVIIIFKPLKIPVISGHGHFRSFSFSYALPPREKSNRRIGG